MYAWLEAALEERFEPVALLKESGRGSVTHLRHKDTGKRFILRRRVLAVILAAAVLLGLWLWQRPRTYGGPGGSDLHRQRWDLSSPAGLSGGPD